MPSDTSNAAIKTIANALRPLQYAVLTNTEYVINGYTKYLDEGNLSDSYRGQYRNFRPKLKAFTKEVASKVLIGVYKASHFSPGNIFYAHEDHVHEAALIAIADSALQEHRGFSQSDRHCRPAMPRAPFEPSGISRQRECGFRRKRAEARFRYLLEQLNTRLSQPKDIAHDHGQSWHSISPVGGHG